MNGGFERQNADPTVISPPLGWTGTGRRVTPPTNGVHGGLYLNGSPSFAAAALRNDEFICQLVRVNGGCCFTLSFAFQATGGGNAAFGVASVTFLSAAPPGGACTPPLTAPTNADPPLPPTGNHFLIPPAQPGQGYQSTTLVSCAPATATVACICFVNKGFTELKIDSVSFAVNGGACATCTTCP